EQEVLRKDTRLLLGLCLDSHARYQASMLHLNQAGEDYRKALDICRQEQGETHPQTLVLMSDLATILDLQGRHDDALALIQQAVDLSHSMEHPDHHVLLGNLAGVLLHTGEFIQGQRVPPVLCWSQSLWFCSPRPAGGFCSVLPGGSGSGQTGRRPGCGEADSGGIEGGEEEEEPGEK
ncbi:hypothetical protein ILYODFUR_037243, partial [Ilyodon furcidens]